MMNSSLTRSLQPSTTQTSFTVGLTRISLMSSFKPLFMPLNLLEVSAKFALMSDDCLKIGSSIFQFFSSLSNSDTSVLIVLKSEVSELREIFKVCDVLILAQHVDQVAEFLVDQIDDVLSLI